MNYSTAVLIVGAGPYAFALADELWESGVEALVVGEPFATWHRHTLDTMELRSDPRASEIPSRAGRYRLRWEGAPDRGRRVPIGRFREYLRQVETEAPFPVHSDLVGRLERADGGFVAECAGGGRIGARWAVVATGPGRHLHLPPELARLPRERVLHSWHTRETEALGGRRVLVVGGGQSGAEAVDRLRRENRVTWAVRRTPLFFREPLRLPTPLFKTVVAATGTYFRMPASAQRALGSLCFRTTVTPDLRRAWEAPEVSRVVADAAALDLHPEGGGIVSRRTGERYDRVVAATGFRYSAAGLPFLSPELARALGDDGPPRLTGEFETAAPGLFLAGGIAEGTFGPGMRFIIGSRHTARRLGAALARRSAAAA
ncbi:MAG: NAD(P)-binding domain-containing protein [Thermoanaerobaculia bacterium]|nr:NAD(P)-binding domain-containing protein [Thermoanaerobaculia bacterium]